MKKQYPFTHSPLRAVWATALVSLAALPAVAQSDLAPIDPAPPIPPSVTVPAIPVEPLPPEGYKNTDATVPDRKSEQFITKVSMLQSEEARLSVIAAQRASRAQVRSFAEQLRSDNQTRDRELAELAQQRNVTLPTGKDAMEAAEDNEKWQKKDAMDFDEDYVQRIIRIQKRYIDALEDCAKSHNADPELSAFAEKHLPELRNNLRQAESMRKQVD